MPVRLVLICHAATEATRLARFPADEDVDPRDLAALAEFSPPNGARWLSAPELRARRTADAAAGREAEIEPALRDWNVGAWRGLTLSEIAEADAAAAARWRADPGAAPHGGESLDVLLARAGTLLETLAARGNRIAAVTHPAVIRASIAMALDAGPPAFWRIDVPPLASARVSHDGRRWTLQALVAPRKG